MKKAIVEQRSDFSGGLNVAAAKDTLNPNELARCLNVRVEPFGGLTRRLGSRKLNTSGIPVGNITAVKQWLPEGYDDPDGQMIAICNGNLYWADQPYTTFTEVASTFASSPTDMATFRDASPSAPLVLFLASGGDVFKWTGTVLTKIDGVQGVPKASQVRAFGTRLFMNDILNHKTLYWSKIGIGDDFRQGGVSDGGEALVDTFGGDILVGLEVLGSSLLIATPDSISRFSGTGDDIQIAQNSFGITNEVGPQDPSSGSLSVSWTSVEQVALMYTPRGAYAVTEAGVVSIGDKINSRTAQGLRIDTYSRIIAGHNKRRNEVWFAYQAIGDSFSSLTAHNAIIYNYRMQCWYGPFRFPFGITSFGNYKDANGLESIIAGCDDGFIRALDDLEEGGSLDDGTTDFTCEVEFAPFFGPGPFSCKVLEKAYLQTIGNVEFDVTVTDGVGITEPATLVA